MPDVQQNTVTDAPTMPQVRWPGSSVPTRGQIVIGFVIAAYVPLLLVLTRYLWHRPHYQFFPIVLAGVCLLIYSRWPSADSIKDDRRTGATSLLVLGMMLLAGAIAVNSPWLAGVSTIITTAGLLIYLVGRRTFINQFFGPWCLLWLIIPLPFRLDARLVEWLQSMTSRVGSSVLDLIGIHHLMAGNILEFPSQRMFVEEACSGIHSLFSLLACVGLFVVWARRPLLHCLLLLASAVFWAFVMNTARVLIVAIAYAKFDVDLTGDRVHETLGVVVFVLALLVVASTDQFLLWLGPRLGIPSFLRRRKKRRRKSRSGSSGVTGPTRSTNDATEATGEADTETLTASPQTVHGRAWESPIVAFLFAVLLGLQLMVWLLPRDTEDLVSTAADQLTAESLPAELNGWKQTDYEFTKREATSIFGEYSKTWTYQAPICDVAVSFDYPFDGWHEVTRCYRSHGWNIVRRDLGQQQEGDVLPFVQIELTKPSGEHGYLIFGLMNEAGEPMPPPRSTTSLKSKIIAKVAGGPLAQLIGRSSLASVGLDISTYQIQAFAMTNHRLSAEERSSVRQQFQAFSKLFHEQCGGSP